jgi:hypothetical protein
MNEPTRRWSIVGTLALAVAAAAYACAAPGSSDEGRGPAEGGQATVAAAARPALHRGVGALIPAEAALRWVGAYAARHPDGEVRSIYFGRDAFAAAVRWPGAEGLSLQFALNDEGKATLALVPLDRDGKRLPDGAASRSEGGSFAVVDNGVTCPPLCAGEADAHASLHRGVGAPIAGAVALRWTRAYRAQHPEGLHSVFYGREVLEALLARPGCEGVSIERGLDDEGREVLVLVPRGASGEALPREGAGSEQVAGEGLPYAVDNGLACPPVCSTEDL